MAFDVKITTIFNVFDLVAPFTCRGCGALGELLCERCKNYNIRHALNICGRCKRQISAKTDACKCISPVYCVSYREGVLLRLVEEYKYKAIRASAKPLAVLMASVIPCSIGDGERVIVVPLPTISRHIRERGFDHTLLLGKKLARARNYELQRMLIRANRTVQVGSNKDTRVKQAKGAYKLASGALGNKNIDKNATYLLIDDIWTTGASMEAAIDVLKNSGARKVVAAVILIPGSNT